MAAEKREMSERFTLELAIFYKEHFDNCSNCGNAFVDRDTQNVGFDESGNCMNVCNKCEPLLSEVVYRYSHVPRLYIIPEQNDSLWRYMDFAKFVSLLKNRALYFSAAKLFKDPFEGAIGVKAREKEWDENFLSKFKKVTKKSAGNNIHLSQKALLAAFKSVGEESRECTFINCWHLNEYESEAMWSLYVRDRSYAIAIRTTYERLYNAIGKNPLIDIGRVNYIDYAETFVEIRAPFWYKRKSFQHENEVRAILTDYDKKDVNGLYVEIDLEILLQAVYISPSSPDWVSDLVADICGKYNVSPSIKKSDLTTQPFY